MPDSMWYKKLSARQLPASQLDLQADVAKRDAVREAIQWSWAGYEKCAWGSDELQPLSCSGVNLTSTGAIGYTIIDGLDTLLIAGLNDEYKRSAAWCRANLNFDRDGNFNTFETTIRVLGGLLATHYLASLNADPEIKADAPFFLERATDIGDRLLGAFSSPSGLPLSDINLHTRVGSYNGYLSLAEVATLQLELKYLSHLTEDEIYWQKAERVMEVIKADLWEDSVQPIFMQASTGKFVNSDIRLGSRGDSYYEYLLK